MTVQECRNAGIEINYVLAHIIWISTRKSSKQTLKFSMNSKGGAQITEILPKSGLVYSEK